MDNKSKTTSDKKIVRQNQTQHTYGSGHLRYERINIFIMAGILLVTAIYAYFSYGQWSVLNQSMKLDQRAWMGITRITGQIEVGKPITISMWLKNSGKTPAKNVEAHATVEAVRIDVPPDFTKEQSRIAESKGVVTPQQEIGLLYDDPKQTPLSEVGLKAITSGKERIYIHGIVNYEDIFGNLHWITFCYYLNTDGKNFAAYKEHNDTDNN